MIGDVATMHDDLTTIAALHEDVTAGAESWLVGVARDLGFQDLPARAPVDVAIIGMACVMPGAADLESFWANIVDGVNTVTEVPAERWDTSVGYNPDYDHATAARDPRVQSASKWGGYIPPVEFDALAYGIPPASLAASSPASSSR